MKGFEYWTIDRLVKLPIEELLRIFRNLEPPVSGEMQGEYSSRLPMQFEEDIQIYFESRLGHWLGKAYSLEAVGNLPGQGYNLWLSNEGVIRKKRFGWKIGNSNFDGKPSLIMQYSVFNNDSGADGLRDEIRRVKPGLYMGIYYSHVLRPPFTLSWDEGKGHTSFRIFFLFGPTNQWRGVDDPEAEILK